MKINILISFFCLTISIIAPADLHAEEQDKVVMMQPLTVHGKADKPAVFFVPRAKIAGYKMFNKSFYNEIIKEFNPLILYKQKNNKNIIK